MEDADLIRFLKIVKEGPITMEEIQTAKKNGAYYEAVQKAYIQVVDFPLFLEDGIMLIGGITIKGIHKIGEEEE